MLQLLALSFVLFSPSNGSQCNHVPVSIPIQDIQVRPDINGSNIIGLRTQVGSPPQDIIMLPWAEINNTWIYDYQPYCDPSVIWSDLFCVVRRGNYFYENASLTWDKSTNMLASGGASQETYSYGAEMGIPKLLLNSLDGADTIAVGSTNLTNFPIGIPRLQWDLKYTTLHALGMGSNSTFLNSLVRSGTIASRVWSIFWGRMWIDEWLDGSMVLGGYDSELVMGRNYTQALDYSTETGCWTGMMVTISNIQLNFINGTDVSILPDNYVLPVCIVPHRQVLIEAPISVQKTFNSVTGMEQNGTSYNFHWNAPQYTPEGAFHGDMTISLTSGLSIRVPNDQYLVPSVYYNWDGRRYTNDTILDFLWNSLGNDQPATLGRYFFTSAYLMVNHDSNSFTLWEANPTTSSNLIPVLDGKPAEACEVIGGPSVTDTSAPSRGTPEGTVAGGIIGGIAILAIIGLGAFLLIRRRKRAQLEEAPKGPSLQSDDGTAISKYAYATQTNGQVQHVYGLYELPLNDDPREIGGHELIGEMGEPESSTSIQGHSQG